MRVEVLIIALVKRREEIEKQVFQAPPQSYEGFVKQLGVWIGLGDALGIIEDARKKDEDED